MKFNAKYQLGKGLAFLGLATLTFAGCDKDPVEPNNPQPQQKHNVELVYRYIDEDLPLDTIRKYASSQNVDSVLMIPKFTYQHSTAGTAALRNIANKLRTRHNENPRKVFGKGELQLSSASVENNPEIVRFFRDTLMYNVVLVNTK